jgi:uncharacterized protein (DUF2249 family)
MATLRAFLRGFDSMALDEAMELRHRENPEPVLRLLQRLRPHSFEWHPIERGRHVYRVQIIRRRAASPLCPSELLEAENHWMDAALTEVDWRAERRLWPGAWSRWGACRLWLQRHRDMEEPLCVEVLGMDPERVWAVAPLHADHVRLERMGREIAGALTAHDTALTHSAIADLREALSFHLRLARQVLHPRLDAAYRERPEVAEQMQSV